MVLRHEPSRDKMLEMLQRTRDNSIKGIHKGERPDALLRLLLWRVAQLITDEAVKTAQGPGKQVLLFPCAVGSAAKTSADMRATRCIVVPADDNHVKLIWAAESRPELRELGRVLRAGGVLAQFGIATTAPGPTGTRHHRPVELVLQVHANHNTSLVCDR